ncbi:hypothetical protein DESUT3_19510 [Desulfuromonas versatilis]|uniref:Uncharacterized protein n=1 Tax=Desulfuromonas versatilis TaxID=2802975 RepID=A0ABM8HVX6_9BACT|nr:hypothetical protein DESUT3_19510 [Desulfuromonas versatilis]
MLKKFGNQQIVNDILFCGSTERSWEETGFLLSNLYEVDINSKEIYAFCYLYEINKMKYIDSPLTEANSIAP